MARDFATTGTGTITMNTSVFNALDIGGNATFAGGSTTGLLTLGEITVRGNFTQTAITSVTSFAPSGTHTTAFVSTAAQVIDFGSPGTLTAGSHFAALDLTGATGGAGLTVNSIADSLFSSSPSAKLTGAGASLTARRVQVSGLIVDNAPIVIDEQGSASSEDFSGVTFQGFPTTGTTMLDIIGPGGTLAARPAFTTSNVNFQALPTGAGNLYVNLTSINGGFFTLTMTGSNQSPQIGGNGPALSNPPNQTTVGGATINWP